MQKDTNHQHNHFTPAQIAEHILQNDAFSKWMGVKIIEIREGYSRISMNIHSEMINGFGIVHGGIAYAFADTALALACANRNRSAVALDNTISYLKPVMNGDTLIAETTEIKHGKSTGVYTVKIFNQDGVDVAFFKGSCFFTGKPVIQD